MRRRWSSRRIRDLLDHVDLQAIWGEGKVLCPWHKDHRPSLHIYPDHVFCYVCREAHNGLAYLQARYNYSFFEAIEYLEHYRGKRNLPRTESPIRTVPLEEVHAWHVALLAENGEAARRWLQERGIGMNAARALQLGWKEDRQVVIPHFVKGEVVNLKLRVLPEYQMDGEPKYSSLSGHRFTHLYPYDAFCQHFTDKQVLFITEGEFDAIVLLQAGLPALSLPSGVDWRLTRWRPFLCGFDTIFVVYDQDSAGKEAAQALWRKARMEHCEAQRLGARRVEDVWWPVAWGKDITEAREQLVPLLKEYYNEAILQL